jgi:hypothetical protein
MNPYVVDAFLDALELFAFWASRGDFEKAEDWAITTFGLSAMWPDPSEAAWVGEGLEHA